MWPNRYADELQQRARAQQTAAVVEPPVHADARSVLTSQNITVEEIVRVNPDSILYLGTSRRPFTAWLWRSDGGGLQVAYESGFAAVPTEGLVPRHTLNLTDSAVAQYDADGD